MIAPVCGSVYILCIRDQVPTMTTCTVGDRTLIFEKVVEVEEIDNEDDSGNCIQLLCHPVNGIEVSSNIMTLASSYFEKRALVQHRKVFLVEIVSVRQRQDAGGTFLNHHQKSLNR